MDEESVRSSKSAAFTSAIDSNSSILHLIGDIESTNTYLHVPALRKLLDVVLDYPQSQELVLQHKILQVVNKFVQVVNDSKEYILSTTILHVIGVSCKTDDKMALAGAASEPLLRMIHSSDEKQSKAGSKALEELIGENSQIRQSLLSNGFIQIFQRTFSNSLSSQSSSSSQSESITSNHIRNNLLDLLLKLITTSDDLNSISVLIPLLEEIKQNSENELKSKSRKILSLLAGEGISLSSESNEKDEKIRELEKTNKQKDEELKRKDEEQKRNIEEIKQKNDELQKVKYEKERKSKELQNEKEDNKKKSVEIQQLKDENTKLKTDDSKIKTEKINEEKIEIINKDPDMIELTITDGVYSIKKKGEDWSTVSLAQILENGIWMLEAEFKDTNGYSAIGIVRDSYDIPANVYPLDQEHMAVQLQKKWSNSLWCKDNRNTGNIGYDTNQIIRLEFDSEKGTLIFFIGGIQQPVYISGIQEKIRFILLCFITRHDTDRNVCYIDVKYENNRFSNIYESFNDQNRPTSPIRTTPSTRAEGISQIIQTSFPHALRSPTGNYVGVLNTQQKQQQPSQSIVKQQYSPSINYSIGQQQLFNSQPNSAERHIPTFLTNAWQTNLSQSHLVTTSSTRKNAHEMPGFKRPNQPIANNLEDSKYHPSKQTGTTILSPPRSHSPIHGPFVQKPFCGAPNVIGSGSDQLRALLNSSETVSKLKQQRSQSAFASSQQQSPIRQRIDQSSSHFDIRTSPFSNNTKIQQQISYTPQNTRNNNYFLNSNSNSFSLSNIRQQQQSRSNINQSSLSYSSPFSQLQISIPPSQIQFSPNLNQSQFSKSQNSSSQNNLNSSYDQNQRYIINQNQNRQRLQQRSNSNLQQQQYQQIIQKSNPLLNSSMATIDPDSPGPVQQLPNPPTLPSKTLPLLPSQLYQMQQQQQQQQSPNNKNRVNQQQQFSEAYQQIRNSHSLAYPNQYPLQPSSQFYTQNNLSFNSRSVSNVLQRSPHLDPRYSPYPTVPIQIQSEIMDRAVSPSGQGTVDTHQKEVIMTLQQQLHKRYNNNSNSNTNINSNINSSLRNSQSNQQNYRSSSSNIQQEQNTLQDESQLPSPQKPYIASTGSNMINNTNTQSNTDQINNPIQSEIKIPPSQIDNEQNEQLSNQNLSQSTSKSQMMQNSQSGNISKKSISPTPKE